jgi:hypothetical protein
MRWLVVVLIALGAMALARAEESDPGKSLFMSSCASCHGDDGKGDGPRGAGLRTRPADLTKFAKNNRGVFPVSTVYRAIDGRAPNSRHQLDDMPVWGCRHAPPPPGAAPPSSAFRSSKKTRPRSYAPKPNDYEEQLNLSCDSEDVIANRILSIVDYLRRIQEK